MWAWPDVSTCVCSNFPFVDNSNHVLRVVLADDHHFFREGLREMLVSDGMVVIGEAQDGAGAVRLVSELTPDVVVIDLKMPKASGLVRQIVNASPMSRAVVLTVSTDEADVLDALTAGACCYLLKDTRAIDLIGAVRLAARGHAVLSPEIVRALASRAPSNGNASRPEGENGFELTARELEVLRLLSAGADNTAIGQELSISPHTVKRYVTNIFEKLGVQGRVQAAVHAVRNGLV